MRPGMVASALEFHTKPAPRQRLSMRASNLRTNSPFFMWKLAKASHAYAYCRSISISPYCRRVALLNSSPGASGGASPSASMLALLQLSITSRRRSRSASSAGVVNPASEPGFVERIYGIGYSDYAAEPDSRSYDQIECKEVM